MKNLTYIFIFLIFGKYNLFAQVNNITIVDNQTTSLLDAPIGSYFKDVNGAFNQYLGIWTYQNGIEKITFTIKKITKQFLPKYSNYGDFIVADYKYIDANGTIIIDTSILSDNSNSIYDYKIFCSSPTNSILDCSFKDVPLNKNASIIFSPVVGNPNQMSYRLVNYGQTVVEGQPFVTAAFSIPNNITVTKEP